MRKLPHYRTQLLPFLHDIAVVPIAWLGAYWLRYNLSEIPSPIFHKAIILLPLILLVQVLCCWAFGLYRGVWQFASIPDLIRILKAVGLGICLSVFVSFIVTHLQGIPRSIFPLYALLLTTLYSGPRLSFRLLKEYRHLFNQGQRVLIIGAGQAGEGLVRDLKRDVNKKYFPVAFVDDSPSKQGLEIHGVRVVGKCKDIPKIIDKHRIKLIFIAMPSANSASMRKIVNYCEKTDIPFHTLPGLNDLASGRVTINELREVSLEDLLGRDQVILEWDQINQDLHNKIILVTGAGGSIGAELCRQIASLKPRNLVLVENSEFNLYKIEKDLQHKFPHVPLSIHLASVRDPIAMQTVMEQNHPEVIFHAAAYKHVPLLENQIRVAVDNNILGTYNLATSAAKYNVGKFILISTDKAVNPTNVMGATKRAAEIFCQNLNIKTNTQFITVRFGNVLGSAGSVIPLFQQQLQQGGPITVTHPKITRYFMTIPEACQLIMQATVMGNGGEIFVLDMGEPISIRYLAEQMIYLSGKQVNKDINIIYTGLRPGEKLHEELFHKKEKLLNTQHKKILKAQYRTISWENLSYLLKEMQHAINGNDTNKLYTLLVQLVPEYKHHQIEQSEELCSFITD